MKSLPPGLQAHLDGGVTTLCWCWRLTRADGVRLGFTDHDRDLYFDDTLFEAAAGFTASEIRDAVGLNVDGLDAIGALSSARLNEDDLAGGLFDDAAIAIWRVNWQDPAQRVLVRSGSLGEVRRGGAAFTAELRGLAHYLNQPRGRRYQFTCDADLGDGRCGVDLDDPAHRAAGAVLAVDAAHRFQVSGLDGFAPGWFTGGLLAWTSGANAGRAMEVRHHGGAVIELWHEMATPPAVGDGFTLTAGCDKTFATCRAKFANGVNFRGFPHIPGNDFVIASPRAG